MYRAIATCFLLIVFAGDLVNIPTFASTTPSPMSDHEKKLRQAIKENRSFQLPSAPVLNQAITDLGMEHFLEKTDLVNKIAGRHLKESGIYLAVDLAYYDYIKDLKNNISDSILELITDLEEMKPLLIKTILHTSKEVPNEL